MKILVVGDQHFRLDLPYADHVKDRREEEKKAVFETIHKASEDANVVVLVGDNLHARHNHSSVIREYVNFLKGFGSKPLYIISGNHEVYNGTDTAIDFLRDLQIPSWHIFTKPTYAKFGETIAAWFVPYMTNAAMDANSSEEARDKIMELLTPGTGIQFLFHHHAVSGTKTLGAMTDLFNEVVLPREELEKRFNIVVGGHIHQPDYSGNTIVTGCVFTSEMGEERKSVWKIDTSGMKVEEIPLPVRPLVKFEVGEVDTLADVQKRSSIPKNAIVKCINRNKNVNVDDLREFLSYYDGYILVEDYPNERVKTHIEGSGDDMSVEALLKSYAKQKGTPENEILEAFELVR